jgi:hypothetical protein
MSGGRFINVRKLAALDLLFRGSSAIPLAEFSFVVFLMGGLGVFSLLSRHALWIQAIGVYLVFLGLDYFPLLIYGLMIAVAGSAKKEAEPEASDPRIYKGKYGVQQALVLVPLVIPVLALMQEAGGMRDRPETTKA